MAVNPDMLKTQIFPVSGSRLGALNIQLKGTRFTPTRRSARIVRFVRINCLASILSLASEPFFITRVKSMHFDGN